MDGVFLHGTPGSNHASFSISHNNLKLGTYVFRFIDQIFNQLSPLTNHRLVRDGIYQMYLCNS